MTVFVLDIICTDRQTHKRTGLARVDFYPGGAFEVTTPERADSLFIAEWSPDDAGRETPPADPLVYQFRCPRCTRRPQIKGRTWAAAMQRQLDANTPGEISAALDLSLVPF